MGTEDHPIELGYAGLMEAVSYTKVGVAFQEGARCAEVAAARAAMVLDHAGSMGLTEHHQRHAARRPHGLPLKDGSIAAQELSIHTLCGHALVPCSLADAVNLGSLHAAAAEGQLLKPAFCLQ